MFSSKLILLFVILTLCALINVQFARASDDIDDGDDFGDDLEKDPYDSNPYGGGGGDEEYGGDMYNGGGGMDGPRGAKELTTAEEIQAFVAVRCS